MYNRCTDGPSIGTFLVSWLYSFPNKQNQKQVNAVLTELAIDMGALTTAPQGQVALEQAAGEKTTDAAKGDDLMARLQAL